MPAHVKCFSLYFFPALTLKLFLNAGVKMRRDRGDCMSRGFQSPDKYVYFLYSLVSKQIVDLTRGRATYACVLSPAALPKLRETASGPDKIVSRRTAKQI